MATTTAGLNAAADAVAGQVTDLSLHTASPGVTGANELTAGTAGYARVAKTYGAASGTVADIVSAAVFNVSSGVTVTHWGAWVSGTFIFGEALAASQAFASDGQYTLTSAPYDASDA